MRPNIKALNNRHRALATCPAGWATSIESNLTYAQASSPSRGTSPAPDKASGLRYLALMQPITTTKKLADACARMIDAGIPMVSQSVLLRGVNDDVATLERLMRAFVECRIKPYYLHHADLAPGTAHFRTTLEQGQRLMRALRGRVSGLAQPLYVLDIPGGYGKVPVGPPYLDMCGEAGAVVEDINGVRHAFPSPSFRVGAQRRAPE